MRRQMAALTAGALLFLSGCATLASSDSATAPAVLAPSRTAVGHAELEVHGAWTGHPHDDGLGVTEMIVDDGTGTSFSARLSFRARSGDQTLPATGAMTPNGHLVIEAGDDATVEAHITDPSTLDYCLVVYGFQPTYACGRLVRTTG